MARARGVVSGGVAREEGNDEGIYNFIHGDHHIIPLVQSTSLGSSLHD